MDEQRRGPKIVPIQPNDVFLARINNGLDANSLDADEVILTDRHNRNPQYYMACGHSNDRM